MGEEENGGAKEREEPSSGRAKEEESKGTKEKMSKRAKLREQN